MDEKIRLNKYISAAGLCSRRKADEWIESGKVLVNGEIAQQGMQVGAEDVVVVNGSVVEPVKVQKIVAFYKPKGYACTAHRGDSSSIYQHFEIARDLKYIGRLDKDSEGLLLLTTDGDLCNAIAKARNRHEKEYIVWVNKTVTESFLEKMANGVNIYDKNKDCYRMTNPCKVKKIEVNCFSIILTQGMNRQIRRMCEELGYRVKKLKRVRVVNVTLKEHQPGDIWEINQEEEAVLRTWVKENASKN